MRRGRRTIDDDVARELYAVGPDEFMAKRAEVAARLKQDGAAGAAAAVAKLRKPTVAAWIVNAFVLEHPDELDRLADIGDRLRAAQHKLEAPRLRELSQERRALVGTLTKQAFELAQRRRLVEHGVGRGARHVRRRGRRPRRSRRGWAGCNARSSSPASASRAGGPPQLTLVRGGRDRPGQRTTSRRRRRSPSATGPRSAPASAR